MTLTDTQKTELKVHIDRLLAFNCRTVREHYQCWSNSAEFQAWAALLDHASNCYTLPTELHDYVCEQVTDAARRAGIPAFESDLLMVCGHRMSHHASTAPFAHKEIKYMRTLATSAYQCVTKNGSLSWNDKQCRISAYGELHPDIRTYYAGGSDTDLEKARKAARTRISQFFTNYIDGGMMSGYAMSCSSNNPREQRLLNLKATKAAHEREISWFETLPDEPGIDGDEPLAFLVEYSKDFEVKQWGSPDHFFYIVIGRAVSSNGQQLWTALDRSFNKLLSDVSWDTLVAGALYQPAYHTIWWEITEYAPFFEHPPVEEQAKETE